MGPADHIGRHACGGLGPGFAQRNKTGDVPGRRMLGAAKAADAGEEIPDEAATTAAASAGGIAKWIASARAELIDVGQPPPAGWRAKSMQMFPGEVRGPCQARLP